jgi:predicted RNA-binding Zn ribbon-like protein
VQAFANTHAFLGHADELADLASARRACRQLQLPAPRDVDELDTLRSIRDDLRALIAAPDEAARRRLNKHLRGHPVVACIDDGPQVSFGHTGGVCGAVLAEICAALLDSEFRRLHTCHNTQECAVVFYDSSRSRQGRWCTAQLCGNRLNSRNHRARQRANQPASPRR